MKAIFDAGPWVALIDKSESLHENCKHWSENFQGQLYSTEAVLTEVLYLLNFSIKAQMAAVEFVIESIIKIVPANIESMKTIQKLMKKYSDLPMDYADATIVCLAQDSGIQNIISFNSHFHVYRLYKNKSFILLP